MNIYDYVAALAEYGVSKALIEEADRSWAINGLLGALKLDSFAPEEERMEKMPLEELLRVIVDDAISRGVSGASQTERDLLDTKLMGTLVPRPSQVVEKFEALYSQSPRCATDWYYDFSRNTDYIRTYRVAKDLKWQSETEYGAMDITVNLSKPEKDPVAIAAAAKSAKGGYPKCLLCRQTEGYNGRLDFPARENHRLIPIKLTGEQWYLQYSPYVYYNEHCIVLSDQHRPMKVDRAAFERLTEFVEQFPHYFLGGNADLPIVGGSILSHDHFQGGRYQFPMERAPIETPISFPEYEDVKAGIVRWPMSVIRLACADRMRVVELGDKILTAWRGYTDEKAFVFAETDGEKHNTVSPIARFRNGKFELDLTLRNNITTPQHPLGVFHPHSELHHIKKENIGLIEVMGLAILPARLQTELKALAAALADGADIKAQPMIEKHALWAEELKERHTFTHENAEDIIRQETGAVFSQVLEHAGVFKRDTAGREAFMRFIKSI